jgi:hypothetical protein
MSVDGMELNGQNCDRCRDRCQWMIVYVQWWMSTVMDVGGKPMDVEGHNVVERPWIS